ncbi:MAG: carboxyvinyl-carboxyphosphonate phosphorylmutase [Alphaproteobacteria bacterium]|jgi:2-methylisocitrate lyase-like PEP mutase family enzyme|nr:carboxyvinyl-carboxyphosphonate phosphorylmutase [Alphaproteobacteria bacterium]
MTDAFASGPSASASASAPAPASGVGLKARLAADSAGAAGPLVAPGIYDGLSALIAEQAGFEAVYLSGASIAYTRFGRPDVGLVSFAEVADTLAAIRERIALPIVVDADTGFGNALNVRRTVAQFERFGANAIQLEDQTMPKRCGHLSEKRLVGTAEMVGKIKAAVDARQSADTLIVGRTDAIGVEGFAAALDRADAYVEAGADVLFVEAPQNRAQLEAVPGRFGGRLPLMANMVEGGRTPMTDAADLGALGYGLVIFPGALVRALAFAARDFFATLKTDGATRGWHGRMLDFKQLNGLLGTAELLADGKRYDPDTSDLGRSAPSADTDEGDTGGDDRRRYAGGS